VFKFGSRFRVRGSRFRYVVRSVRLQPDGSNLNTNGEPKNEEA